MVGNNFFELINLLIQITECPSDARFLYKENYYEIEIVK